MVKFTVNNKAISEFLKQNRGTYSYEEIAKLIGCSSYTVHRAENLVGPMSVEFALKLGIAYFLEGDNPFLSVKTDISNGASEWGTLIPLHEITGENSQN